MADKYSAFRQLEGAEPAEAYRVEMRDAGSAVAIVAPHGGGIEPGTSEVSRAIARDDISLYLFEGTKKQANSELHITSTSFDEPQCLALLSRTDLAVTVHGEGSAGDAVYVGGLNRELAERCRKELSLRGFRAERHRSALLQGSDPQNICNRCVSGAGVQLELSYGLRKTLFKTLVSAAGRAEGTERLSRFGESVRAALMFAQLL